MRVWQPEISEFEHEVVASAAVEVETANIQMPPTMWFAFPKTCRGGLSSQLDGFAAALLPLAMTLGEDLHLEGALSPRLFRGLEEYQRLQCAWRPTSFTPVGIEVDALRRAERSDLESGVASSFSGGVDSFYTLWRHLPPNENLPDFRITHCLMINGFDADSDLDAGAHFEAIAESFRPVLGRVGVELVVCRTNYMSFSDPNILKQSFGAMVTAPALILSPMLATFFVPASYRFNEFFRDGSHLLLDHLLSTESMQTVHDSSHLMRPEKTAVVSAWEPAQSVLRVCFSRTAFDAKSGSVVNCGRCEKCMRTMKTLEIFDRLSSTTTFARKPSRLGVWSSYYGDAGARLHAREILRQSWRSRKLGIFFDYCVAIALSFAIKIPRDILQRIHLALEEGSEGYATTIRRLVPRLRKRGYWIRASATHVGRREPTSRSRQAPR